MLIFTEDEPFLFIEKITKKAMYPQVKLTDSITLGKAQGCYRDNRLKDFILFYYYFYLIIYFFSYSLFLLGEVQGFEKKQRTSTEKRISMILQFP
jgi:hypothetical protein